MARILLIDDDAGGRELAVFNLRKAGHDVREASCAEDGLEALGAEIPEVLITDVRMPGISGIDLARKAREISSDLPILVITAFGTIAMAVEAIKAGAFDFVLKPFSRDQLLLAVDKALESSRLVRENRELRRRLRGVERPIVAASAPMASLLQTVDRVASSDAAVLISGESGTGKELIARRIHARSARAEGPFVVVNGAAIPPDLLEAELFGHERGAFTGAVRARAGRFRQAHGGTLFLDEVAELPAAAQGKLLRVLQEGTVDVLGADRPTDVDVRVIAASNRALREEVAAGAFREDLFFRLNVIDLHIPPLREHPEDIAPLAHAFVDELARGRELTLDDETLEALRGRAWPGNVRELRNAIERMVTLCVGEVLRIEDLPHDASAPSPSSRARSGELWEALPEEGLSLLDVEKQLIERVLERTGGNISEAARYLRIPRHILVYRIAKHGIER